VGEAGSQKEGGMNSMKKSIYLDRETLALLRSEAHRQDRSVSWLVKKAIALAAPTLAKFPGVEP
jgi:uncharacterized small protein (TIGR04563 family)